MGHLPSLENLTCEVNPSHLGDWPFRIGQYMLNFAAIELISYQYLNSLEATRNDFNNNLGKPLAVRVQRIRGLVGSSLTLPQAAKDEIDGLWQAALDLSSWRNRIAHNPVLPTWKTSDPNTEPPDLMGIPDMNQLKSGDVSDTIAIAGLVKLIDATVDVAARLSAQAKGLA